ncbi:hypothetical protein X777_04188 [Ooceraea biroi]|uniref:Uncharacterized protein n=1 Tax=Ooceraea biroi TaxID=2015173 RepID=A0A026WKQ6_OOCBI|nr:hypothetical protein X777_04188 [Ooceraea biroi]
MRGKGDKEDLMEKGEEAWRRWGIGIDEDLTIEERRMRWRLLERAKGKIVKVENRKMEIDGVEWIWDEREQELMKKK